MKAPFCRRSNSVRSPPPDQSTGLFITFDDGNQSDAKIALPALVKRGLRASFFICAGRIGRPGYLDRVAIRDLLDAGMEVGSHGMRHLDWRKIDDTTLNVEISRRAQGDRGRLRTQGRERRDPLRLLRPAGAEAVVLRELSTCVLVGWRLCPRRSLAQAAQHARSLLARQMRDGGGRCATGPGETSAPGDRNKVQSLLLRDCRGQRQSSSGNKIRSACSKARARPSDEFALERRLTFVLSLENDVRPGASDTAP